MTTEANKRLVRQFYEDVVSTGDLERIGEFVAPDCVENTDQGIMESGVEGMIEHVKGVRDVYADLRITVERQVAEGEWVVSVITARGTHEANLDRTRSPEGKPSWPSSRNEPTSRLPMRRIRTTTGRTRSSRSSSTRPPPRATSSTS